MKNVGTATHACDQGPGKTNEFFKNLHFILPIKKIAREGKHLVETLRP